MNAQEAKQLTEKSKKGEFVFQWLNAIYKKIKIAAEKGESKITDPFSGFRMPNPTKTQQKAVLERLENDGYKISLKDDLRNNVGISIEW